MARKVPGIAAHLSRQDWRLLAQPSVSDSLPTANRTRQNIAADGKIREIAFEVPIPRSSWIALRILPSSHTNPIFVLVDGKPIRASRRSAEWCLQGVEKCFSQKDRFIKAAEKEDAKTAWAQAKEKYQKLLGECEQD